MALPRFGIEFQAISPRNSILAIGLGFFSKPIIFALRLFALGSMRSGRWPTVWLADAFNDIWTSDGAFTTQANSQVDANDCCVVVKLKDLGILR